MPKHAVEDRAINSLRPYSGNARTHSKKQVRQIANSIRRFGFTNPVLISDGKGMLPPYDAPALPPANPPSNVVTPTQIADGCNI